MKKVKISVIVPIYNVEKWLSKCINSILAQNFKDFELILINDGSTDNSEKICYKFLDHDNRVKYFYKKNGGLSSARNLGIKKATGKYIVFIDSDDYVDKNYLQYLYESVSKNNSQVAICNFNLVDEKGNILDTVVNRVHCAWNKNVDGKTILENIYGKNGICNIVAWNKIYLKDIFSNIEFAEGRFFEDEYINAPLFWNVSRVSIVNKALYNYVQRKGSITQSELTFKKVQDINDLHASRVKFFKNKDKALYVLAVQAYKSNLINIFTNEKVIIPKKYMNELQNNFRSLTRIRIKESFFKRIQDIVGYINIKLAGKLKKYM